MSQIKFPFLLFLFLISFSGFAQIAPPYIDDFEGANNGWTTDSVSGSNWELGFPSTAPTNTVHSGSFAWDVDLDNVYLSNTESYLVSPVFDFSGAGAFNSILSFWQNRSTEGGFDGARVDYSTNNGVSWSVLGALNSPGSVNWYNNGGIGSSGQSGWDGNSNGWIKSSFPLAQFNGVSSVIFRFAFNSDNTTEVSGFTMDDISISPPPINDVGVIGFYAPIDSLPEGSPSPVTVIVKNFGQNIQTSFPVTFSVNGLVGGTSNYAGTLASGNTDTLTLGSFNVPPGIYSLCAYTELAGDGNMANDTLCDAFTGVSQALSVFLFDSLNFVNCINPPIQDQIFVYGSAPTLSDGDTINVSLAFGDGQDTTYIATVSNGIFFSDIFHNYLFSGQFSCQAIVGTNTGLTDTVTSYNQLVISDSCGNISGKVYADLNNNCIEDGSDYALSNIPVSLMQGGNVIQTYYTNTNGDYFFIVPSATTYDLQIDTNYNSITAYCPASGKITGVTEPSSGNKFALVTGSNFDVEPFVNPFNIAANAASLINLNVQDNNFNILANGTLKVVIDTNLLQVSSSFPAISSVSGDTLIWNITNLGNNYNLNAFHAWLWLLPKTTLTVNSSICFTLVAEPLAGDAVPANNIKTVCGTVVNSYDPNNKTVEPAGNIAPQTSSLTYTINFQNTGNAPAYNVFILDTISNNLDISTLRVLSSSHSVSSNVIASNVVKFGFDNIFLPDSSSDAAGSHGYVTYTIAPKAGLADQTQIENTAYIYFDFNPAIITNTTSNTIDYSLSGVQHFESQKGIVVYPNPASQFINIVSNEDFDGELILTDVFGKLILKQKALGGKQQINIAELASGFYSVTLKSAKIVLTEKIMIVK